MGLALRVTSIGALLVTKSPKGKREVGLLHLPQMVYIVLVATSSGLRLAGISCRPLSLLKKGARLALHTALLTQEHDGPLRLAHLLWIGGNLAKWSGGDGPIQVGARIALLGESAIGIWKVAA